MEVIPTEKRRWIRSGVVEELDKRQTRLLELVDSKIKFYYAELYRTRPCYQYPLSLWRLMKLCNRSSYSVSSAIRLLANTIPAGSNAEPVIYYDRHSARKNRTHRPYRIFLRQKPD